MQGMNKEKIFHDMIIRGELEINMEGEIWRRQKRHGRGVKLGGGYHKGSVVTPCKRVRAEYKHRQGYLLVAATQKGRRTVTGAHRIVWAWYNRAIPTGLTINHKNGVKDDNRPGNLELMTYSEQRRHALDILKVKRHHPTGSKHPKTKLQESDVRQIRVLRSQGMMVKDIASQYLMKPKAISAICCRRTWTHI